MSGLLETVIFIVLVFLGESSPILSLAKGGHINSQHICRIIVNIYVEGIFNYVVAFKPLFPKAEQDWKLKVRFCLWGIKSTF